MPTYGTQNYFIQLNPTTTTNNPITLVFENLIFEFTNRNNTNAFRSFENYGKRGTFIFKNCKFVTTGLHFLSEAGTMSHFFSNNTRHTRYFYENCTFTNASTDATPSIV
jgi:hypothetical protein